MNSFMCYNNLGERVHVGHGESPSSLGLNPKGSGRSSEDSSRILNDSWRRPSERRFPGDWASVKLRAGSTRFAP